MKILRFFFGLLCISLVLQSCITKSEPLFFFIQGKIIEMKWDENGFLSMELEIEEDSIISTLTDIKFLDRYAEITKNLKEDQLIEIKGIKECPLDFGTFFGAQKTACYIEIREFRLPEQN